MIMIPLFSRRVEKIIDSESDAASLTGYTKEGIRKINYNFGYSVVMGYFRTREGVVKSYVVGSPYGSDGHGTISFFTWNKYSQKLSSRGVMETDDENAVGSMFGAVLCAARLTAGRTHTTLLVGAPTHARFDKNEVNRGAVYFYSPELPDLPGTDKRGRNRGIYLHSGETIRLKELRKLVGQRDGGLFGSAIAALGDYNGDGLDEIAIAAPYDPVPDSRRPELDPVVVGAVYIYSSKDINSGDSEIRHIQRITPAPNELVTSFGFSLTTIEDFDDNGCNELAIGAPESNRVMLLKCIAAVTVKVRADIPKDLSLRDDNPFRSGDHFTFKSCLDVTFPKKPNVISASFRVYVELHHPNVTVQGHKSMNYEVMIRRTDGPMCKNITAAAPRNGYYQLPVYYSIVAEHLNPPEQSMVAFDVSRVAVSDRSLLTASSNFWLNECKNKTNCLPDLKINKTISVTSDAYEIGSSERITLSTSVWNEGEAAYGACLRVAAALTGSAAEHLGDVRVAGIPTGCTRDRRRTDELICRPFGALRHEDQAWATEIEFDSSQLSNEHKLMNISVALYNECSEDAHHVQYKGIWLNVDFTQISVKGITDAGVSNAVNMSTDDVDGKLFEHSYTITTKGLTNWANLEFKVIRENRTFIEYAPIYMSSGNSEKRLCWDTSIATEFICFIRELNSKLSAKVIVPMKIISPDLLETAIDEKQNSQSTALRLVLIEGKGIFSTVTSTFNLGGKVALWIIIAASLVALLILIIFIVLLITCGFFKRQKKVELKKVRNSVRRQTVMRRTMQEGMRERVSAQGRQSLLASLAHQTADEAAARDKRVRLDSTTNKAS